MKTKRTLKEKAYDIWKKAGLPDFLNKYGPKQTPGWLVYACHLEYTSHAPAWRRASNFMACYYCEEKHWTTWHKAISKWPQKVWDKLREASVDDEPCEIAAIDGTMMSRTNASEHYLKRIDRDQKSYLPMQEILLVDITHRRFLCWRIRSKVRGEKCDVPYLIRKSPITPDGVLMDKGFDSNPLHAFLREQGIWSVAPVRKGCKRGRYRKEMRDFFDWALYWQRNIVESLISAVKRIFGSHVRAKTACMQRAELSSRFIAYNIGVGISTIFYRAL